MDVPNCKSKDKQDNSIKKKNKMVQRPSNNLDFFNIQIKIILLELKLIVITYVITDGCTELFV
jgi:hypothetical protein